MEDNAGDIRLTQEALKEIIPKAAIEICKDGKEAFEYLNSNLKTGNLPQLILLDLNLPRMGGLELLELLKSHGDLRRIPIVILTTSTHEQDIKTSYDLHANCYLTKPIELDHFLKVVESLNNFWFNNVTFPPT